MLDPSSHANIQRMLHRDLKLKSELIDELQAETTALNFQVTDLEEEIEQFQVTLDAQAATYLNLEAISRTKDAALQKQISLLEVECKRKDKELATSTLALYTEKNEKSKIFQLLEAKLAATENMMEEKLKRIKFLESYSRSNA